MSPAHQSGRRRYAERAAAETATSTPAVGHQRASDKRIQISAAEADALIEREATKHSPGPWHVDGDHVYADVTVDGQPFVEMIASVLFPDNGPLIAAAPDLLAALLGLVEWIDFAATDSYCEVCCRHAPKNRRGEVIGKINHAGDCRVAAARAAIAKAKGGAG